MLTVVPDLSVSLAADGASSSLIEQIVREGARQMLAAALRAEVAAMARLIPRRRWTDVFLVTPATLLAWHRGLAANPRRRRQRSRVSVTNPTPNGSTENPSSTA